MEGGRTSDSEGWMGMDCTQRTGKYGGAELHTVRAAEGAERHGVVRLLCNRPGWKSLQNETGSFNWRSAQSTVHLHQLLQCLGKA